MGLSSLQVRAECESAVICTPNCIRSEHPIALLLNTKLQP